MITPLRCSGMFGMFKSSGANLCGKSNVWSKLDGLLPRVNVSFVDVCRLQKFV